MALILFGVAAFGLQINPWVAVAFVPLAYFMGISQRSKPQQNPPQHLDLRRKMTPHTVRPSDSVTADTLPASLMAELEPILKSGSKLTAIKMVREHCKIGLKESHDIVSELVARRNG